MARTESALDTQLLASIAKQMFAGDEVEVRGKKVRVGRTSRQGLRTVEFRLNGREYEAIEQNAGKPSRWGQLARLGHIVENWKDGYNSGDPEAVASLYAPDATYLTQHFVTGVVHGGAAIKAYVKKGTDAHYRVTDIALLASDCSGSFAYAITRYESTNADQKAVDVNLVVLQKINGKWLIVAHESAVPDPATAIQNLESPKAK